jgi:DNA-binding transcriptional ArsR family regulator
MSEPTEPLEPRRCAALLCALAEADRLRIVDILRRGPRKVSDLATVLGIPVVNLSHHLGVLRRAGLVRAEKSGRFVTYSLPEGFFRPADRGSKVEYLDLGCCRLEISTAKK